MKGKNLSEFERVAARAGEQSFLAEFWTFLREKKKWWLIPFILVMLIFSALFFLSGTGLAPFIYTLF
jgi:hypothetical protein